MSNSTTANFYSITWCVTYSLVAMITVAGNVLTIAVLLRKNSSNTHKAGTYFMLNLALADTMVGALALPMFVYIVYAFMYSPTKLSPVFKHVYTAVDVFTGLASVLTLTAIALDRLYAITLPLDYRFTSKKTYVVIINLVWIFSGSASIAYLLSAPGISSFLPEHAFTIYLTGVSVLSLLIICAAYTTVWIRIHLWNKGNLKSASAFSISQQEKRLASALFIVTVVFVLTWSPFHILNILANFKKSVLSTIPVNLVFFGKLLHYINSLANPAIYSLKIPQFRRAIWQLLCKNYVPETRV